MSDKAGRAIINGSDSSSSSSMLPQDVEMQSTTPIETTKTKVVISKTLKKKVKKTECPGLKAYLKSFKKAKKQEVQNSLKTVLLKDMMKLFTQHHIMHLCIQRKTTAYISITSSF